MFAYETGLSSTSGEQGGCVHKNKTHSAIPIFALEGLQYVKAALSSTDITGKSWNLL